MSTLFSAFVGSTALFMLLSSTFALFESFILRVGRSQSSIQKVYFPLSPSLESMGHVACNTSCVKVGFVFKHQPQIFTSR